MDPIDRIVELARQNERLKLQLLDLHLVANQLVQTAGIEARPNSQLAVVNPAALEALKSQLMRLQV